jgi:hypothetical protein
MGGLKNVEAFRRKNNIYQKKITKKLPFPSLQIQGIPLPL